MELIGYLIKYFPAISAAILGLFKAVTTAFGKFPNPLPLQMQWRKMVTMKGEFIELSYLRAIKSFALTKKNLT